MKTWIRGLLLGVVIGAFLGFFPPFNLLSVPIMELISDSMKPGPSIIFIFVLINAIIYGIIGTIIALFKQRLNQRTNGSKKTFFTDGSKSGLIISLIGSLILLLPFTVTVYRGVLSQGDFYFPSIIFFAYGVFILIFAFLMRKRSTLNMGAVLCLVFGTISLIVLIVMLFSPILLQYSIGEFFDGGNYSIIFLWASSSVLSVIGGVLGKVQSKSSKK